MARASNTATASEVCNALSELCDVESFAISSDADYADVADKYSELITRLLSLTSRPTASILQDGMSRAFPDLSRGRIRSFSALISGCVSVTYSIDKNFFSHTNAHILFV